MYLFNLAVSPVAIILFYIYIRDKYEKEPLNLLVTGVLFGIISSFPIMFVENFITTFAPDDNIILNAFYISFFVASFVEELFKFLILFFLILKNKNFNEKFDGIVYAVFISLGFAALENILYVFNPDFNGAKTAISRAFFSIPAHALFGVNMGYYMSISKFENKKTYIALSFLIPFLLHGIYDFILLSEIKYNMIIFIIFLIYLWFNGFKKINEHIKNSPFKNN